MKRLATALALAVLMGCQTAAPTGEDDFARQGPHAGHYLIAGGLVLVAAAILVTREDDDGLDLDAPCPVPHHTRDPVTGECRDPRGPSGN